MRQRLVVWGILAGVVILLLAGFLTPLGTSLLNRGGVGGQVAVVELNGVIGGSGLALLESGVDAVAVMDQLQAAREDDAVAAVVLRLNSPGGGAAASQEIAAEVTRIKETGKVVVASMGETAASGAYWIAATADRIVANPATMTGSIGVIMELQNLEGLYNQLGITSEVIKSGPHKDMGSATRGLTPEELAIFQGMVDDIYQQFVDVVAKGRQLPREQVLELADGRVFTGRQALERGLIDELGNYNDAIRLAAGMAGIEGEPEVVTYAEESLFSLLFGGVKQLLPPLGHATTAPTPALGLLLLPARGLEGW